MSQISCPRCGRELLKVNPGESLLSVCTRCRFTGCMVDDIAAEFRHEILQEQASEPQDAAILEPVVDNGGRLF
jgi:ribosome-binding protein aMBF1 (putative translation factor)